MNTAAKIALSVALVAAGGAGAFVLIKTGPKAKKGDAKPKVAVVRTQRVLAAPLVPEVTGFGVMAPEREARVSAEVAGRVVWQSDALVAGGRVKKGTTLVRVDARDYRLQVAQAQAQVQQAELNLALEEKRSEVAAREWRLLGDDRPEAQAALALRKPQLANAHVQVQSAKSALELAKLRLERTSVRAPFDALITTESVEKGQVVGPNGAVATLVGTARFLVEVRVGLDKLPLLHIPGIDGQTQGSRAVVVQRLPDGSAVERAGEVLRLAGGLDPATREARVVVAVKDPLDPPKGGLPMLTGAYVEVHLFGPERPAAIAVPTAAVKGGNTAWVVGTDGKLHKRIIALGWRDATRVQVTSGLSDGDNLVVTPLAAPLEGMGVKVVGQAAPSAGAVNADGAHAGGAQ